MPLILNMQHLEQQGRRQIPFTVDWLHVAGNVWRMSGMYYAQGATDKAYIPRGEQVIVSSFYCKWDQSRKWID